MTDDLHTRIAAAIAKADEDWCSDNDLHEDMADAVIRELTNPIRGCTDLWHWSTGKPYQCPSCGYWMGEGYV